MNCDRCKELELRAHFLAEALRLANSVPNPVEEALRAQLKQLRARAEKAEEALKKAEEALEQERALIV